MDLAKDPGCPHVFLTQFPPRLHPIRATRVSKWQLDAETRYPPPLVKIKPPDPYSPYPLSLCVYFYPAASSQSLEP